MIKSQNPEEERARLAELDSYSILDTLPEEDFDNLTVIASQICGTPISLVSLVDEKRQWFKSRFGLAVKETPREYAICADAIANPQQVFIVEDTRTDERFQNTPLVTGAPFIVFYAGVPLVAPNGMPLGTLCVIDRKPKKLTPEQITSLEALAKQVMKLMELRRKKQLLEDAQAVLEEKNDQLDQFASLAAHDLKSPLVSISGLSQMLISNSASKLDPSAQGQLEMIKKSADRLKTLVDGLLNFNTCLRSASNESTSIDPKSLEKEISEAIAFETVFKLTWTTKLATIHTNHSIVKIILTELVGNAIRYNFKDLIKVNVDISENGDTYDFKVTDNGAGIAINDQERIFKVFQVARIPDRFGVVGNGIGLATVKKVIDHLGGTIGVSAVEGKGSVFAFSLRK